MLANGILETTTTTGTGNLTTTASGSNARMGWYFATNQMLKYSLLDSNGVELEWGIGTYLGSNVLARTVVCGTVAGSAVNTTTPTAVSLTGTTTVICTEIMGGSVPGLSGISSTNSSSGSFIPEPNLMGGSAGTITLTANLLYLQPARLASPRRVTAMKFRVSTNGSGSLQIGLYKCSETGDAKELLLTSGDIALPVSGVTTWTLTSPTVLPPDWYYIGIATKGTAPVINTTGSTYYLASTPLGTDSTGVQPVTYKSASLGAGWTSLPTTAPTSLSATIGSQPPAIGLVLG